MKKALRFVGFVALAVLVGATAAAAGSLGPSAAPANTMYTLADVYALVTTGTTTASSGFSTPGSVSASMYSLSQIVDAFASSTRQLQASNIVSGATILGVAGSASAGAPTLEWDTRSTSTNMRLCWEAATLNHPVSYLRCYDGGEGYGGGLINHNGNVLGAKEYCDFLEADGLTLANSSQGIWRLPTVAEISHRYFNENKWYEFGAYGDRDYWTADRDLNGYSGQASSSTDYIFLMDDSWYIDSVHRSSNLMSFRCVKEI